MSAPIVRDLPEKERYVIDVEGVEAGFAVYHVRAGDRYLFVHTEIHEGFQGTGVGKILVKEALDDVRLKGAKILPICPFVWHFVQTHIEYQDLIDHDIFDRIADRLQAE